MPKTIIKTKANIKQKNRRTLIKNVKKRIKKQISEIKFQTDLLFCFLYGILSVDVLEQGCHFLIKNIL